MDVIAEDGVGANGGVFAQDAAFANDGVRADGDARGELGGGWDESGGVDAGGRGGRGVELADDAGESAAGMADADHRASFEIEIGRDDEAACGGGDGLAACLGGDDEGDVGCSRGFEGSGGGDGAVAIAFEGGAEQLGEVENAQSGPPGGHQFIFSVCGPDAGMLIEEWQWTLQLTWRRRREWIRGR